MPAETLEMLFREFCLPTFAARCYANVPTALKLCHVGYVMLGVS